jgi:hypothetical protein
MEENIIFLSNIEVNERPGVNSLSIFPSFWKGLFNLTIYKKSKTKDYIKL